MDSGHIGAALRSYSQVHPTTFQIISPGA